MYHFISKELSTELRTIEIAEIQKRLADTPESRGIVIVGAPGCGKSALLSLIAATISNAANLNSIIDFSRPSNKSRIGIISAIAKANPRVFATLLDLLTDLRIGARAPSFREIFIEFRSNLQQLKKYNPILFFDNLDSASTHMVKWIIQEFKAGHGPRIVATARVSTHLPSDFRILPLTPFTARQVSLIANHWHSSLSVDAEILLEFLIRVTGGNAVRIMLAGWTLAEHGTALLNSNLDFENFLRKNFQTFEVSKRLLWICAITAKYRFTQHLATEIRGPEEGELFYKQLLKCPFTFLIDDPVGGISVHEEAASLIASALEASGAEMREAAKVLYDKYPQLMLSDIDRPTLSLLHLERIKYYADYDLDQGARKILSEYSNNIRHRNFATAEDLARIIDTLLREHESNSPTILKLAAAQMAIGDHHSGKAFSILQSITPQMVEMTSEIDQVLFHYLCARTSTCPSPRDGADIFIAVQNLEVALERCIRASRHNKHAADFINTIRMELANAYRLTGRNLAALAQYNSVIECESEPLSKVEALEEKGQLYRLMQDLGNAVTALNEANAIRVTGNIHTMGVSTYFYANIQRDRGNFDEARKLYLRAETELIDSRDDFTLCELYCDSAWLSYLTDDVQLAEETLEQSENIAQNFGFGRELSEHAHMRYHFLYDAGKKDDAYAKLASAYALAKRYGNVYILLDCLMHKVQERVENGDVETSQDFLDEMIEVEARGAGIVVFRGRALIAHGDGFLAKGQELKAYGYWKEGFELVAKFGNSRTNVDLFIDLAAPRQISFTQLHQKFSHLDNWPSSELIRLFPEIRRLVEKP